MKKKILFLVTVLAFMVAMPIASAEVLEAKDVTTLVEMVKKAKDGDTVKLTADITGYDQKLEINGKRTITLDMNGHNITYLTGSESFIGVYGATLIVKGSGVITNDTDSGLNVYGKETKDDSFVSKLIVEKDVTLKGKYGLAIFWDTKNGSIIIPSFATAEKDSKILKGVAVILPCPIPDAARSVLPPDSFG